MAIIVTSLLCTHHNFLRLGIQILYPDYGFAEANAAASDFEVSLPLEQPQLAQRQAARSTTVKTETDPVTAASIRDLVGEQERSISDIPLVDSGDEKEFRYFGVLREDPDAHKNENVVVLRQVDEDEKSS